MKDRQVRERGKDRRARPLQKTQWQNLVESRRRLKSRRTGAIRGPPGADLGGEARHSEPAARAKSRRHPPPNPVLEDEVGEALRQEGTAAPSRKTGRPSEIAAWQ